MKQIYLIGLAFLLAVGAAWGQDGENGTVYSYTKDGVRHYSANPPPPGSSDGRSINYRYITPQVLTGVWVEKAGNAVYTFSDGYNFEYRNTPNLERGIWTLAPDNCAVGSSKGNLYVQAGTYRCCHNAHFLGSNLVLTALAQPAYTGVCSDRVLVRQTSGEG